MADNAITIKQGDHGRPIRIQILDNGNPAELAGTETVLLHAVLKDKSVRITNGTCTIEDPENGWVSWTPDPGDTNHPGIYDAEIDVDGEATYPSSGYLTLTIEESLDPA